MDFTIDTTVLFKKVEGQLIQVARLKTEKQKLPQSVLNLNTSRWSQTYKINGDYQGAGFVDLDIPALEQDTPCRAELNTGTETIKKELVLKARRRWEIHVQNFTHTDIGYTDLPSRVARGYQESMRNIIDFCKETENFDQDSQYRWNVETGYWLEQAISNLDKADLEQVKKLTARGRIEIAPLYVAHTSEFNDEETLIRSLYFAFWFADQCGVSIKSAMASDVTGQPWMLAQILPRAGVKYFSTAVNATLAKALKLPRPFYWEAQDGSRIMVLDTDERQAYQEGVMVGLTDSYERVLDKLPQYLYDLETEQSYGFDLLALRAPGYPGDNTRPNVKVSYIVRDWNQKWEYPQLKISTYTQFFEKFEQKYGQQLNTYKGAWPDWWVNYHGASAFETGVNRHTHADIIAAERLSVVADAKKLLDQYPNLKLDYIYKKMFLADEADWSSYLSVAEPDSLQSRGQRVEEAAFVYQAAIEAEEVKEKAVGSLTGLARVDSEYAIVVFNSLGQERSEIVEAAIPKKLAGQGYKVLDSVTGKRLPVQIIETTAHDFQTGCFRIAFKAGDVPPLGFKVFNLVPEGSWNQGQKEDCKGVLENDFYRLSFDPRTGEVAELYDQALNYQLIDKGSNFKFNQLVYETTVEPRVVDLSEHDKFSHEALYLQPYFRKLHKEFYDYPPLGTKFKRYIAQDQKILKVARGEVYTEILTQGNTYMCPVIKSHILLNNTEKQVLVKNYLEKHETLDVEAVYYAFPFGLRQPRFLINCHAGYYQPEEGQLPGSSKDWQCVQKYVDISNSEIDIMWSPLQAPLVQLGDINTGKWLDKLQLDKAHIYSFALNNHWWTNSPASQGGRFWFDYSITSRPAPFDPGAAYDFGWAFNTPMETRFIQEYRPEGVAEFSFMKKLPDNIKLLGFKKAEQQDDFIVRLVEVAGSKTEVKLKMGEKPIKDCQLSNPVEKDIQPLAVNQGLVQLEIGGHQVVTLRLKF